MRSTPRIRTAIATFGWLLAAMALFALPGCSSRDPSASQGAGDAGGCQPYVSAADLSIPRTFTNDVMPIFQQSCALSTSCHGDPSSGPIQPYLGTIDGGDDGAALIRRIVGVRSVEDPTMDLVAPSDPTNSFLMHKMDADECTLARACAGTIYSASYPDCGSSMPYQSPVLPVGVRDAVRGWIKQGAK